MNPFIDKIKALLAKASSSEFEAEAAAFAAKAQQLMELHQISVLDLHNDDPLGIDDSFTGSTSASYKRVLYVGLADYYGCSVVRHMTGKNSFVLRVVGRESARLTTVLMYPFIMDQVKKAARELHEKTAHLGGVTVAMLERRVANALAIRLAKLTRESAPVAGTAAGKNALITMDAVRAYIAENIGNAREGRSPKVRTNERCMEAAEGISLARQAASSSAKKITSQN